MALSGGVDSSVTAILLKKQGYAVTGVFIKVWQPDFAGSQWKKDCADAKQICDILDIPFVVLNLGKEYRRSVFDYMITEYQKGRTPNPDVMCNKKLKFGAFLDFALKNGADFIATGHYVYTSENLDVSRPSLKLGRETSKFFKSKDRKLMAGADKNKDQSYFLWTLTQKQLKYCLFPIGQYKKSQVRKLAEEFGLPTARKKDSQGLCIIGKVKMKEFLRRFIPQKQGDVLNQDGEIIGRHKGVYFYTLGQRHGFEISKKGVLDKPYYIFAKDFKNNSLTVLNKPAGGFASKYGKNEIEIKDINWIAGAPPDLSRKYKARIRYRQPLQGCGLQNNAKKIIVKFDIPQWAATPGQSLVIYDGEICLGGGVIV